jgi:sodium-dependent dicarboxylate transporter 2/3/5
MQTNGIISAETKRQPISSRASVLIALSTIIVLILTCYGWIDDPKLARSAMIAGICLVLWLSEAIPLYATTLLLWVGIASLLGPLDSKSYSISNVLSSAANPVMALFFGGFALSAAGTRHGIDAFVAGWLVRTSGGSRLKLLFLVMLGTAVLSMWMSNIAAGAMMIATLRPLFGGATRDELNQLDADAVSFRTAMLLGIAFAADFGGMATPVGTGPNLIAIGAISHQFQITFLQWMSFAVPLAIVMVLLSFFLISRLHRVSGNLVNLTTIGAGRRLSRQGWAVVAIFSATVVAWLLEPLHGIPAGVTALGAAGALFALRLLDRRDLMLLEWDTLLLIAGGLTLGELFSTSGLAHGMAAAVDWHDMPLPVLLIALVLVCAFISAVASNTAAAAMLIQIALSILPMPSVAVLVALGASMGVPFVISTPPNSMAYGQGGLRSRDFLVPGMILMIIGSALLALTGPTVLRWMGVP